MEKLAVEKCTIEIWVDLKLNAIDERTTHEQIIKWSEPGCLVFVLARPYHRRHGHLKINLNDQDSIEKKIIQFNSTLNQFATTETIKHEQ